MNTLPPCLPKPYTGNGTSSLLLNKNPNSFPPSFVTGAPDFKLYVAPQKLHCNRASPPVSSFPSNTLALAKGILQLAHDDEK